MLCSNDSVITDTVSKGKPKTNRKLLLFMNTFIQCHNNNNLFTSFSSYMSKFSVFLVFRSRQYKSEQQTFCFLTFLILKLILFYDEKSLLIIIDKYCIPSSRVVIFLLINISDLIFHIQLI